MTLITRRDLEVVALLGMLTPVALLAPESSWPSICRRLALAAGLIAPAKRRELMRRMPAYLPRLSGLGPQEIVTRHIANSYEENLGTLRERLDGWRPRLTIVGRENLDEAISSGGAVLWVAEFEFSTLVTKKALAGAGYRCVHLARPAHGFSSSRFGRRFLNPIQIAIEDRYLEERVVMGESDMIAGLRRLRERLQAGAIVSITVSANAVKAQQVPLFEDTVALATGPVTLARSIDRPLLPVFTIHTGQDFEVRIEPPLDVRSGRDDLEPYLQYAEIMESILQRWPLAWRGWSSGIAG